MPINPILGRLHPCVTNKLMSYVQLIVRNNLYHTQTTFETSKTDPRRHNLADLGLLYKIDNKLAFDLLFDHNLLRNEFMEKCKTFNETAILIKQPALEIINCLNNTDFNTAINKYVLFGDYGAGKSMTLAHLIHYAHVSQWLIVDFKVSTFLNSKETMESVLNEGMWNTPKEGTAWLKHFKIQNEILINKLNLTISKDYKWNVHESNEAGSPLLNLVNYGIVNPNMSCEVINFVLEEIKTLSSENKVRTLVALNDFSLIFSVQSGLKGNFKKIIPNDQVTLVKGFKSLLQTNWHNAAVVGSCFSPKESPMANEYLPMNQLGTTGFEFMDPFVPIYVPKLTRKEMDSVLSYYKSKLWIPNIPKGDLELRALCAGNHLYLSYICESL